MPDGEGDLVLSGHIHGGQLGLVSLGPDGFPLHVGVPGGESVLAVHRPG